MKKFLTLITLVVVIVLSICLYTAFSTQQLDHNKQAAVAFLDSVVNKKDPIAAIQYLGPRFIQHDPDAEDGPKPLQDYIQFLRSKFPNAHYDFKNVFAEGDFVILHVHSIQTPGTRGRVIVHIFKFEKGKIVEHWEVIEEIPATSKNNNGIF